MRIHNNKDSIDIWFTAAVTVAAGNCLYVGAGGSVYLSDPVSVVGSTGAFVVGFALTAATAGNPVQVRIRGIVSGLSSLTVGRVQYISTTPGALTETLPTIACQVGIAISSTQLLINDGGSQSAITSTAAVVIKLGYILGGGTGVDTAITDKITFSTDSTLAQTTANLSIAKVRCGGISDGSSKGFIAGGETATVLISSTDKITFSIDATSANSTASLTTVKELFGTLSGGTTKGYLAGGTSGTVTLATDKITYATETCAASTASNLSSARSGMACCSDASAKGYFMGGSGQVTLADKITISTDVTVAQTTANLTQGRRNVSGMYAGSLKGYACGGASSIATSPVPTTDKVTYSTDATIAQTTANLTVARSNAGNVSDASTKGYILGGTTGVGVTTADKITFSTDATIVQTSANLSVARLDSASVNTSV